MQKLKNLKQTKIIELLIKRRKFWEKKSKLKKLEDFLISYDFYLKPHMYVFGNF